MMLAEGQHHEASALRADHPTVPMPCVLHDPCVAVDPCIAPGETWAAHVDGLDLATLTLQLESRADKSIPLEQ